MFVLLLCICVLFPIQYTKHVLQQYEERLREMAAQNVSVTDCKTLY
jgi:hypothetical protein